MLGASIGMTSTTLLIEMLLSTIMSPLILVAELPYPFAQLQVDTQPCVKHLKHDNPPSHNWEHCLPD